MLLEEPRADLLNYWLSRFVVEVRREKRIRHQRRAYQVYPPSAFYRDCTGIADRVFPVCPNFMDASFPELTATTHRAGGLVRLSKH